MRVHDVRRTIDEIGEDRPAEERVALRVVGVPVDLVAADPRAAHEDGAHAVAQDGRIAGARGRRAVGDRTGLSLLRDGELRRVDDAVRRQVDRDLVAEPGESLRERPGDIGQAADLGVGGDLGGREGDAHWGGKDVSGL